MLKMPAGIFNLVRKIKHPPDVLFSCSPLTIFSTEKIQGMTENVLSYSRWRLNQHKSGIDGCGEDQPVDTVEDAAMAGNQCAAVFQIGAALHPAFE